jgi:hypothetical protein
MKRNLMKIVIVLSIAVLFANGLAWAGSRGHHSQRSTGHQYRGYHDRGEGSWYRHGWPRHYQHRHYYREPRYHHYPRYCPPARSYYYNRFYPGDWGRYDGAYYFSGGYSEPGVGFVFGTRGNW